MYEMAWKITVGKYRLNMMEKVDITRSVEQLSDTATITLPATAFNQTLNVEEKLKRGDKVTIEIGYNDNLVKEFDGYLESIKTDGGSLKLNCEDGIFQYRVSLNDIELKNITVADLLKYVNTKVSAYYPDEPAFTFSCNYDFTYDKFVISNATGYDILKKIQEEAKPNIYLKDRVLHVHPQYSEIFGTAVYDFSVNIEEDDLKYKDANERKLLVCVESKGKDGKVIKVEKGSTGGDKTTINVSGITDKASLEKIATEALQAKVYTGFEGGITGWLVPYCDAGYKVTIRDKDYPAKTGDYYVIEVKTEFSQSGGKRTVNIGKRLDV